MVHSYQELKSLLEALEIVCVLTVVSFQLLLGDCQYFFKARSTSLPPLSPQQAPALYLRNQALTLEEQPI